MKESTGIPKAVFWTIPIVALLAIAAAVIITWAENSRAELPVLGNVPQFTLTERSGKTLTLDDLKGHLQVIDFIFTSCPSLCPIMTGNMSKLYQSYQGSDKLHFLSISVDPDRDSLSVLQRYASEHGVSDDRWLFARGPLTDVADLMEKGFMLPADDLPAGHPSRFILVDANGQIRGYYSGDDDSSINLLKLHLHELARRMP